MTEGNRIQISQLRDEFVDEVIEVDTTKLERFFSKEALLTLTDKGLYTNRTHTPNHSSFFKWFAVENMRKKWKYHKCTDITYS